MFLFGLFGLLRFFGLGFHQRQLVGFWRRFRLGFLGGSTLGGGISCPKLSFGGGGPTIARIGVGSSNSGGLYMSGNAVAPTGYSITSLLGLY